MVFEKKQLSKVLAIALMVACAVAFMPLLNGQAFAAAKKPAKVKGVKAVQVTDTYTAKITWKKAKNAKKYNVKIDGKVVKKNLKKKAYTTGELSVGEHKVQVQGVNGKKKGKWSAVKKFEIKEVTPPAPTDLKIESATQTGANTITAVLNKAITAADSVVINKGSTKQDSTFALSDDGKTVTITATTKLAAATYTVVITPADTTQKAASADVVCAAAKLSTIEIGDNFILNGDTGFKTVHTSIVGKDQFGEEVALSEANMQRYPSIAKASDGYVPKTKTYTLVSSSTIPFQVGDTVSLTVIYQDGTNVVQAQKTLTVSAASYLATMEFGELQTALKKNEGKRVTIDRFGTPTPNYYFPVVAKDQYGTAITATELNAMARTGSGQTLFVNPTTAVASPYGGFAKFDDVDDKTIGMFVGKSTGTALLPGKATLSIAALGGFSGSLSYEIEDNAWINTLNVEFPASLYEATPATFTVSATDQYGDAVDLWEDFGYTVNPGEIVFDDVNGLTGGTSSIKATAGTFTVSKDSSKKVLIFKYTPAAKGTVVVTVTSAKPTVTTQTLTIGDKGTPASMQSSLRATGPNHSLTIAASDGVDFETGLVFVDSNGEVIEKPSAAAAQVYFRSDGVAPATTGKYYTITYGTSSHETVATNVGTDIPAGQSRTYTVTLYNVSSSGVATVLDSKEFRVTVADNTGTSTKYKSYRAEIADGKTLLNTGGHAATKATIEVYGTDANGNEVLLKVGNSATGYVLSVDNGLEVGSNGTDGAVFGSDAVIVATKAEDIDAGTATIDVWAYNAKTGTDVKVTDIKLAYSNEASKATEWSLLDVTDEDAPKALTTTTFDVAASDGLCFGAGTYIGGGSIDSGVLVLEAQDQTYQYEICALDQYGDAYAGTTAKYDGNNNFATGVRDLNAGTKDHTIVLMAGKLPSQEVHIIGLIKGIDY